MKNQLLTAMGAAVLSLTAGNTLAATINANVAFSTDYRFRGISQTDKDFAVQAGFDYAWESGLYIGSWASNVDNFSPSPVDGSGGAQTEIDFYAGYGATLTDRLTLDFSALYYYYPGASTAAGQADIDFIEYTPGLTYSDHNLSTTFSVTYSNDFFAESGDAFYYNVSVAFPLADYLVLGAHAGYQTIDDNNAFGTPDYAYWSISLGTAVLGLDWALDYIDTNLSDRECFGSSGLCDATAVATVSKTF